MTRLAFVRLHARGWLALVAVICLGVASLQTALAADGHSVGQVSFGRQGQVLGHYRQVGPGQWQETGPGGKHGRGKLTESGRDAGSVYLTDNSSGAQVQFDLQRGVVLSGGQVLYEILSTGAGAISGQASAATAAVAGRPPTQGQAPAAWPPPQAQPQPQSRAMPSSGPPPPSPVPVQHWQASPPPQAVAANGRNVSEITMGQSGQVFGGFRQAGPGRWAETGPAGEVRYEFVERGRDDWSVYLHDATRAMDIQLDLHRRQVLVGQGQPLYDILSARAGTVAAAPPQPAMPTYPTPQPQPQTLGANGRNVTEIAMSQSGQAIGGFRQGGPGRWTEFGARGEPAHEFVELGRDDWSVYLQDASRNIDIQLDLHRREVILVEGAGRRVLYEIQSARAGALPQAVVAQPVQPVQPAQPPLQRASPVSTAPSIDASINGGNVSQVSFNQDGRTLGILVTQGGGRWREIAATGGGSNDFEETGRDPWSVYLLDRSRNVRLQVDLYRKLVLYGDGSASELRPLYAIHSARADPLSQAGFADQPQQPQQPQRPVQPSQTPVTGSGPGATQWSGGTLPSHGGPSTANKEFCWQDSIPRGVGTIPENCGPGRERIGAFCYTQCGINSARFGFDCHSVCPAGMRNDGLFCRADEYGRGTGFAIHLGEFDGDGMRARCESQHGRGQCETWGAMYYPKCAAGYEPFGCCLCRPKVPNCEALGLAGGFDLSCAKKVVIGDPVVGTCADGEEEDAGLCYRRCEPGYSGVGPVCWAGAPPNWVGCGMGAAKNDMTCASIVIGQVQSVGQVAFNIATLGTGTAASGAASAASKASRLGDLKRRYEQLKRLYETAKPAIEAAMTAKAAAGAAVDAVELMDEEVVTEADILRISAQIAAIADPTGVADTVAAYSYPKCSAYGF